MQMSAVAVHGRWIRTFTWTGKTMEPEASRQGLSSFQQSHNAHENFSLQVQNTDPNEPC